MTFSKSTIKEALAKIIKQYPLKAPAIRPGGKVIEFLEISNADTIIMDDSIPYKSPKEFFFPHCEKLLTFKDSEAIPHLAQGPFVVFGIKPCDLEALDTMAKVFAEGPFHDPYFAAHMENSLIIGVGCREKKPGCFCQRVGVDMSYSNKCDLFLEDNGDSYQVRHLSEKGRNKLPAFLPDLTSFKNAIPSSLPVHDKPEHNNNPEYMNNDVRDEAANPISFPKDTSEAFHKINWHSIAETCIACGLCTFICPTCHCFDFKDVEENATACRYRLWDSCMYPKFTHHASGHNPRPSKTERFRQRVLHKYLYVPQNIGKTACTGCGRCIRSCPAGMNLMDILDGITEALT